LENIHALTDKATKGCLITHANNIAKPEVLKTAKTDLEEYKN